MSGKIIELLTGMLLVLVTGVFWGTWFSPSRTMDTLSPEIFIITGKQIMQNVAVTMSIMMQAAVICLILLIRSWKARTVYFIVWQWRWGMITANKGLNEVDRKNGIDIQEDSADRQGAFWYINCAVFYV